MFNDKISPITLLSHIGLFVGVEIIFVLIVFREFPETNLYSKIGIAHIFYRAVVLICSLRREQAKTILTRSTALWTPIVIHLLIHVWIGIETFYEHELDHEHHDGELIWLIIGTLVAGGIIYWGEKLIHRKKHCDTHHIMAHNKCHDKECEHKH